MSDTTLTLNLWPMVTMWSIVAFNDHVALSDHVAIFYAIVDGQTAINNHKRSFWSQGMNRFNSLKVDLQFL